MHYYSLNSSVLHIRTSVSGVSIAPNSTRRLFGNKPAKCEVDRMNSLACKLVGK